MNIITRKLINTSSLLKKLNMFNYGEIKFTQDIIAQNDFTHVPAYRAYDLEGKLLDSKIKYDLHYLNKILKSMIYIDEMDVMLLKVKAQGI